VHPEESFDTGPIRFRLTFLILYYLSCAGRARFTCTADFIWSSFQVDCVPYVGSYSQINKQIDDHRYNTHKNVLAVKRRKMILPGITNPMAMDVDAADDAGVDNHNGNGSENNPEMTALVLITITGMVRKTTPPAAMATTTKNRSETKKEWREISDILYNQPTDRTLLIMMTLLTRSPSFFGFDLYFIDMGITEFPIKVESTTVSTEHFHHLLNFFILDCTGKYSHCIVVDCLVVAVVDVLFCVLECVVCTNVVSCPFAETSHCFFCYQIRI
jgi:hypothetical protein